MTSAANVIQPRQGRDRVDHARQVMELLDSSAYGISLEALVVQLYQQFLGSPAPTSDRMEFEKQEAKTSVRFINERFNNREPGWSWIRTRRTGAEWKYLTVAKMARDGVVRLIDAAVSYESYDRYYREWVTRTQTLMRMQVSDIDARYEAALLSGKADAAKRIDQEYDDLKIISPRLAALNFGAGIADQNLELLENDRRSRLINKQIKQVRGDIRRIQQSTARLARDVERILGIRALS